MKKSKMTFAESVLGNHNLLLRNTVIPQQWARIADALSCAAPNGSLVFRTEEPCFPDTATLSLIAALVAARLVQPHGVGVDGATTTRDMIAFCPSRRYCVRFLECVHYNATRLLQLNGRLRGLIDRFNREESVRFQGANGATTTLWCFSVLGGLSTTRPSCLTLFLYLTREDVEEDMEALHPGLTLTVQPVAYRRCARKLNLMNENRVRTLILLHEYEIKRHSL